MTTKLKKKAEKPAVISHSITELYYEIDTFRLMLLDFSDSALYDYCISDIEEAGAYELDSYYDKLKDGIKLTKEERNKLEAFCILVNTEMFLSA